MASTNDGFIRVFNNGGFLARFSLIYNLKEDFIYEYSNELVLLDYDEITIPKEATNINLKVEIAMTLSIWRTIYNKNFDSVPQKCFKLSGVTIYANCDEIVCPVGEVGGNNPSPVIPCFCMHCVFENK